MKRVVGLVSALAGVGLMAGGCARPVPVGSGLPSVAPAQPTPSSTPKAASTCSAAGLRVEYDSGDAALGLRAVGFSLINCGHAGYRLAGYPAAVALDDKRKKLPVKELPGVEEIAGPIRTGAGRRGRSRSHRGSEPPRSSSGATLTTTSGIRRSTAPSCGSLRAPGSRRSARSRPRPASTSGAPAASG